MLPDALHRLRSGRLAPKLKEVRTRRETGHDTFGDLVTSERDVDDVQRRLAESTTLGSDQTTGFAWGPSFSSPGVN